MNQKITRLTRFFLSTPIYISACVIMIVALFFPYMRFNVNNNNIDVYVNKVCVDDKCESETPQIVNPRIGQFLMAMYIIMALVSIVCFGLFVAGSKYYNWVGIVAFIVALTLNIAISVIMVTTNPIIYTFMGQTMKFKPTMTGITILVIISIYLPSITEVTKFFKTFK